MKNLKIVAIVTLFAIATGVNAQDKIEKPIKPQVNEHHSQEEDDQIEKFKDQLNLTPEQKEQIKAIRAKRFDEKTELKMKLKELRVAERLEINSILTDEQQGLIKERKELNKTKHKSRGHKEKMEQ